MKNIIYPHLKNKEFKINNNELFYCINVYAIDDLNLRRQINSKTQKLSSNEAKKECKYPKYKKDLENLIKESYNYSLISGYENNRTKEGKIRHALEAAYTKSNNTIRWSITEISKETKDMHDKFLFDSNYFNQLLNKNINNKTKYDKVAFYTFGCPGKPEIFIGGRKELVNTYCKINSLSNFCKSLLIKSSANDIDSIIKGTFDKSDTSDLLIHKIGNYLDKERENI